MAAKIISFTILGILPSLIWLWFYLKKDEHKEPKKLLFEVFLLGAASAIVALAIERGLFEFINNVYFKSAAIKFLFLFLITAFIEECLKYYAVRLRMKKNGELDEPIDFMIYMIVAALGFAAFENIIFVFAYLGDGKIFSDILTLLFLRFVTATFLHVLASGTLGYFLAISWSRTQKKAAPVIYGFLIATFLHAVYNYNIFVLGGGFREIVLPVYRTSSLLSLVLILLIFHFVILTDFSKLKKLKE